MILTDEECLKGVKAEHSAMLFYARAIEAAVLAKLNCAEPVAWLAPGKESLEFSRKDTVYGSHTIPLYLHPPAPSAPEGFTLAPNEPTEAMISAAMSRYKHPSDSAAINFMQMHRENFKQDYMAMLAAAPKGEKE